MEKKWHVIPVEQRESVKNYVLNQVMTVFSFVLVDSSTRKQWNRFSRMENSYGNGM